MTLRVLAAPTEPPAPEVALGATSRGEPTEPNAYTEPPAPEVALGATSRSGPTERPRAPVAFVELCARSNFSFLEGASHPEELVAAAHALGQPALGIADRNGLYGLVRAHREARSVGVKLVVGATIELA